MSDSISCCLQGTMEQLSYVANNMHHCFIRKYPNVVGVGVGYKYINNIKTSQLCLIIMVTQKVPLCCLSQEQIIPSVFCGCITDVVETGMFCATRPMCSPPIGVGNYYDKYRPSDGGVGISLGIANSDIGTLGYAVVDSSSVYFISNNHVLADGNLTPLNTPIVQPPFDYSPQIGNTIGKLSYFVPVKFTTPTSEPENTVDAAIAYVGPLSDKANIIKNILRPTLHNNTPLLGINTIKLGDPISKIGAETQLTTGKVTAVDVTILAAFSNNRFAYFTHQILTNLPAQAGDSGAIGFNNNHQAVGLLFADASKGQQAVFNPISEVLQLLNVGIWIV